MQFIIGAIIIVLFATSVSGSFNGSRSISSLSSSSTDDENLPKYHGEYYGVEYDKETGRLTCIIGGSDLAGLLMKGEYSEETGWGFHLLGSKYYEWEVEEIVQGSMREYIFDLEKGEVRKRTEGELKAYWEWFESKAKEAGMRAPGEAVTLSPIIEPLPDNRIKATFQWSNYVMHVETNSSVLEVKFDSVNKQLLIEIGGESGTHGTLDLSVPIALMPPVDDLKVYLDGSPVNFALTQADNYYSIHAEYTHSTHMLLVGSAPPSAWYSQPLSLALITLAIVAAIGAVYWFRFRR